MVVDGSHECLAMQERITPSKTMALRKGLTRSGLLDGMDSCIDSL